MTKQENELATLSPQQSNPYAAKPEDFEIVRDGGQVFHGQSSDRLLRQANAECNRKPTKRSNATEPGNAEAPHTDGF